MTQTIAFLLACSLTTLIFTLLSFTHIDRIDIQLLQKRPTTFFTLKRVEKKVVKPKKKIKEKIKKKAPRKIKSQKTAPKEEKPSDTIVNATTLTERLQIMAPVIPKYPEIARKAGIQAQVLIELIIDEAGSVIHSKVIDTTEKGYGFESNAIDAIKRLRFKPVKQNGRPIKVKVIYPIHFVLVE